MKITWFSNAPWTPTGYGQQTALFAPRIKADGHDISITANFGLAGTPVVWNGITVIGQGYDSYSNDIAAAHHQRNVPEGEGWMLTLFDAWVLKFHELPNVASWTPVDHLTVPPEVLAWARRHFTIAMSRFGQESLRASGVDARYVPHGVDTKVFAPGAKLGNGRGWRETVGLPADAFIIGIVGANKGWPSRKAWPEMFSAASVLMERHADARLYVHSDITGLSGCDLNVLAQSLSMDLSRIHYVDQFANRASIIPDRDLAAVYAETDVLLSTSLGEGFGIPVIEAQAAGCPVIVTDATAQPELVGAGWKVPGQPWWDAPQRAWWMTPNVASIVDALEEAYALRGDADLRQRATAFAAQYDVDRVYAEHFRPVLAEMESLLGPRKPVNLAIRPRKGKK